MNTVCKIFLIICTLFAGVNVYAQVRKNKPVTADFKIGINSSQFDIEGGNQFKTPKFGVHVGGNVNYKFYSNFQLQSGLFLSKKGSRQHDRSTINDGGGKITKRDVVTTETASYVHVPLNVGYEQYVSHNVAVNVNAGVYAAYGFKGTTRIKGQEVVTLGTEDPQINLIDSGDKDTFSSTGLRRFDYGLGASVGMVYDVFTASLNYEHGLYNISNTSDRVLRNRNVSISIGFRY